jgi:hypothetical protein
VQFVVLNFKPIPMVPPRRPVCVTKTIWERTAAPPWPLIKAAVIDTGSIVSKLWSGPSLIDAKMALHVVAGRSSKGIFNTKTSCFHRVGFRT